MSIAMGIIGAIMVLTGIGISGMQDVCQKLDEKPAICEQMEKMK